MKQVVLLAFGLLLLSACGSKVEGTYEDEAGLSQFTFEPGGKVYLSATGQKERVEGKYEVNGDKVKITIPEAPPGAGYTIPVAGTHLLILRSDGSLKFVRKREGLVLEQIFKKKK